MADKDESVKTGLSFGFSKKINPKKLQKSAVSEDTAIEDKSKDFVLSLEGKEVKSKKPKKDPSAKKYVIPLIKENKWRTRDKDSKTDDMDEKAVQEVLKDATKSNENWDERGGDGVDPNLQVPLLMRNRVPEGYETDEKLDVGLRPDAPDSVDYEEIPIDHFGKAMLRGMGWEEGKGIGKNGKEVAPYEAVMRPKGMGLGAEKKNAGGENGTKSDEQNQSQELEIKKGANCTFLKGANKGLYGTIEGIDGDNARVMVKVAVSGKTETLSQFAIKLVSKKEFDKYSKYINKAKVDKYKEKEKNKESEQSSDSDQSHSPSPKQKRNRSSSKESSASPERNMSESRAKSHSREKSKSLSKERSRSTSRNKSASKEKSPSPSREKSRSASRKKSRSASRKKSRSVSKERSRSGSKKKKSSSKNKSVSRSRSRSKSSRKRSRSRSRSGSRKRSRSKKRSRKSSRKSRSRSRRRSRSDSRSSYSRSRSRSRSRSGSRKRSRGSRRRRSRSYGRYSRSRSRSRSRDRYRRYSPRPRFQRYNNYYNSYNSYNRYNSYDRNYRQPYYNRRHYDDRSSKYDYRQKERRDSYRSKSRERTTGVKKLQKCGGEWVRCQMKVRIVDKDLFDGEHFKEKVTVEDIVEKDKITCKTSEGKLLENIPESALETVIPKSNPAYVIILFGKHKGLIGEVIRRDKDQSCAMLELLKDRGTCVKIDYDSITEFMGEVDSDFFF